MDEDSFRVLHLIDTGGPGGAETIFAELVCGLPRERWTSLPVVPVQDWLFGELERRGRPAVVDSLRGAADLGYLRRLRKRLRANGVALVQTHLLNSSVYATLACLGLGIPVVSTFHGLPDVPVRDALTRLQLRILGRGRGAVVFVSEALRRRLLGRGGFRPERTAVIPNGIDCDVFHPSRRTRRMRSELGLPEDALVVGAVGNVRPSKRYDVLLEAFAVVVAREPRARLIVAGQARGALYEELLALRSSLGLEGAVHFIGFREDVAEVFGALDVFVLSSSDEGFSLSTLQAMATGLPVVATRAGGPEEVLGSGEAGLLVPANDPPALAEGLLSVLSRPEWGAEMGRAARRRAEAEFSLEAMVARYEALYLRALEGRPR